MVTPAGTVKLEFSAMKPPWAEIRQSFELVEDLNRKQYGPHLVAPWGFALAMELSPSGVRGEVAPLRVNRCGESFVSRGQASRAGRDGSNRRPSYGAAAD